MSGGVLSYVDVKSVERNEADEPFSSAWRCIKFDSQGIKVATPHHIPSISTSSSSSRLSSHYAHLVRNLRTCVSGTMLAIICHLNGSAPSLGLTADGQ